MGLIIKALRDGFRRAGIAHRSKGTYYPDDAFTEEQLETLKGEPLLVVIEGAEEPEQDDGNADEGTELEGNRTQADPASRSSKSKTAVVKAGGVRGEK